MAAGDPEGIRKAAGRRGTAALHRPPTSARDWGAGPDLPIRGARRNLANTRNLGQQPFQAPLHRSERVRSAGRIRKLADRAGFGSDLERLPRTLKAKVEARDVLRLGI